MGILKEAAIRLARSREPLPDWRLGQPDELLESKDVIEALNGVSPIWWRSQLYGLSDEDNEFLREEKIDEFRSEQEHTETLRRYMDMWLATGRTKSGSERPTQRRPTNEIHQVVERFFETHHFIPVPLPDGYEVRTLPPVNRVTLGDKRSVVYSPHRNDLIHPPVIRRRGNPGNSFSVAEDAAQRMFVETLLSDWRLKIAACRTCGIYFLLSHPKRAYPSGTYCSLCGRKRNLKRAFQATREARREATQELCFLAATRFRPRIRKAKDWPWNPKLRASIIEFLSQQIESRDSLHSVYPRGITGKWLSWAKNYKQISAFAQTPRTARRGPADQREE